MNSRAQYRVDRLLKRIGQDKAAPEKREEIRRLLHDNQLLR